MPLIKRLVKGSPLTFAEGDANLDYLEGLSNGSLSTSSFYSYTGSVTSQFAGTASFATTASYALFAANGGGSSLSNFISTGSVTASVNIDDGIFRIISGSSTFVYVSSSGNIGLGNIPTYSLDINLGNNKSTRLQSGANERNSFLGSAFGNTLISNNVYYNGSNWIYEKTSTAILLQLSNDGSIVLNNYPSQIAGNIGLPLPNGIIYMSPGGNIGIGTQAPNYKLDILGDINISNLVYLSGSAGNTGEVLVSQGSSNPPIWTTITSSFSPGYTQLLQIFTQDTDTTVTVNSTPVNTTGIATGDYTWSYLGVAGAYRLSTNVGTPFTANKTAIQLTLGSNGRSLFATYEYVSTSEIKIYIFDDTGAGANDVLLKSTIDIKIFP
jgi:hypothetical protein